MMKQYETRVKIIDSLEELLQTNQLENIRISDICKLSGVSRTTFYVYFADIYDAVQWCWDDLCAHTLYKINDGLSWDEGHRMLFIGMENRKSFYQKVASKKDFHSLFNYGYRKSHEHHIENLENRLNRALTETELLELDYFGRAESAMTMKWAEEGMTVPLEKMVEIFHRTIPPFSLFD